MTGHEALKVLREYLVDSIDDNISLNYVFELGRALGTIEQIITQQTKEVLLKAGE